jgi:hypothetical protein
MTAGGDARLRGRGPKEFFHPAIHRKVKTIKGRPRPFAMSSQARQKFESMDVDAYVRHLETNAATLTESFYSMQ